MKFSLCRYSVFIITLLVFFLDHALAIEKNSAVIERKMHNRISALEVHIKDRDKEIISLRNELNLRAIEQNDQIKKLRLSETENEKQISELMKNNIANSELATEGAIILLAGLLIEILGALLLGAPVLAAKIEELSDFEIDPGLDMALHSPKKEAVLSFYSMVGNIFLFIGFIFQFAGTALVLSVEWKAQATIVLGGLFFALIIVYWLLGLDPTQTRKEKFVIVWKNLMRIFRLKLSQIHLRGRGCEHCLLRVEKGHSYIFWYDQGNTQNFPYLNSPSQFLVGHKECVEKKLAEKINSQGSFKVREEIKPHLHTLRGQDFISNRLGDYKKWFVGHYEHWLKINAKWRKPSLQEIALDKAVTRIKRIES